MIFALLVFVLMVFAIDYLSYIFFKRTINNFKDKPRKVFLLSYKILALTFIIFAITFSIIVHYSNVKDYEKYRDFFWLFGFFIAIYVPKIHFILFSLFDRIFLLFIFILKKTIFQNNMVFLTKIPGYKPFTKFGLVTAFLLFFVIIYGIFIGRTDFEVTQTAVTSAKIPESFNHFKIAQISDLHLGSFRDTNDVKKGLDLLMEQKPDIIVFTGDMVNNQSEEAEIMIPLFSRLYAPYGKYTILGNHDMGDYRRWYTIEEKIEDITNLVRIQKKMGFIPLLNQNKYIKKGNDSISIIGVMNWGKPPFKRYGDLKKSLIGTNPNTYKVLLSHDPSHWDAEVINQTDIDLTLAGHTHAMQMGINCCGIYWSPISFKYHRWAGIYSEKNQYLYVNRGFGFIGFPGRISMKPEIAIIELLSK